MSQDPARPQTHRSRGLLSLVLSPLLWAIPFALFFGTLYNADLRGYGWAYVVSLVFAVVIRSATLMTGRSKSPTKAAS